MVAIRTSVGLVVMALGVLTASAALAQDAKSTILKNNEKFSAAYNKGDTASVAGMYAEDAIAFPPGGDFAKGRAGIEAMWKATVAAGLTNIALKTVSVEENGPFAIEVGTATGTMKQTPQHIKYVVVWKKSANGTWQLYRDIWNDMPAGGGSK